MRKVLVLFAHPKFEHSEANKELIHAIAGLENVQIQDLYELYPDFDINVQNEQELLFEAEVVIWHHPFYWYSCPPLLKQWIDLVLEFGWAYGPGGIYLKNKFILNAITSGGSPETYSPQGRNIFTVTELLRPFEQTARLCGMNYLPYFQIGGTHRISQEELKQKAQTYRDLILYLKDTTTIDPKEISALTNSKP